jgi:hypothetical protein
VQMRAVAKRLVNGIGPWLHGMRRHSYQKIDPSRGLARGGPRLSCS